MDKCPKCGAIFVRLKVGDVLYGYCHGTFGRDSYEDKTVLAIGPDWVVVSEMQWSLRHHEPVRILHVYSGDPNNLLEYTTPPPDEN